MFCLLAILCFANPVDAAATNPAPTYEAIRKELRGSAVPVFLPIPIPPVMGTVRSVSVIAAGRSGYYVGFSPVAHCAGALSCAFFHVAGYPRPGRLQPRDRAVRLPDGTRGYFRRTDCSGASCTEASLSFERKGAFYELDAKVPRNSLAALVSVYRNLRVLH